jgi:FkbM family methyltransferase
MTSTDLSRNNISPEEFVAALYRGLLGREPDQGGLDTYTTGLKQRALTLEAVIGLFRNSDEFNRRHPESETRLIRHSFLLAYRREPTEAETEHVRQVAARIGARGEQGYLRSAVAAFDRFAYPTPIQVRFTPEYLVQRVIEGAEGQLVLDTADLSVSDQIRDSGSYEKNIARVLRLFVRPGSTAIDVGANVGFHTQALSAIVGGAGHVYAFEPNSENCRLLLLTRARSKLDNVSVFPMALSDQNGLAFFSPAIGSNGGFMADESDALLHPNCTVIPTMRLDDLIEPKRLDFMKIDVEGAEYLVIQGARSLLQKHRPLIVAEFSLDMIGRISRISGADYLKFIQSLEYDVVTLGTSGKVEAVNDVDQFISKWGDPLRIDDLAFAPRERPIDLPRIQAAIDGGG